MRPSKLGEFMNCIDAIEGVAKNIINDLFESFQKNQLDDTEYASSVKSVIDGSSSFVSQNKEIVHKPDMLEKILFQYSKELWASTSLDLTDKKDESNRDYMDYYFNHIYQFGFYPS